MPLARRAVQMDHAITGTPAETILHGALELSKNSWLLALQLPDRAQPSLYSIRGGDTEGLMAKLMTARDQWAKVSGKSPSIVLCYEAGYDAFWLAHAQSHRAQRAHPPCVRDTPLTRPACHASPENLD